MKPEPNAPQSPADPDARSMSSAVDDLKRLLGNEATLAAARGVSEEALDSIYGAARELYAHGHYAEASKSFELLCLYDHQDARNWHALGICRQVTEDYAGAAAALTFATDQLGHPGAALRLSLAECLIGCIALDAAAGLLGDLTDATLTDAERGRVKFLESRLTELRQEA